jgi:hypothetical protein
MEYLYVISGLIAIAGVFALFQKNAAKNQRSK